jgi:hypothetical protein
MFIWLASRPALLHALAPYFQSLKRETSLAPALRNRMVSFDEPILFIGDGKRGKNQYVY